MDNVIDFKAFLEEGERLKNMDPMDFENVAAIEATAIVRMADNSYYELEYVPDEHGMVYVRYFDYHDREQDFDVESYEFRAFMFLVRERLGWLCDQNQRFMNDWRSFSKAQEDIGVTPRTLPEYMEHMDDLKRMDEELDAFNDRMAAIPLYEEIMDAFLGDEFEETPKPLSEIIAATGLPEGEVRASVKMIVEDTDAMYFLNDNDVFGMLTHEEVDGEYIPKEYWPEEKG